MEKEELENRKLERRAKEWLVKDKGGSIIQSLVNLIKEFTEPREKRIEELETQIEKMRNCSNCDNWSWKHSRCEKKLKGDCFKQSKWILRRM